MRRRQTRRASSRLTWPRGTNQRCPLRQAGRASNRGAGLGAPASVGMLRADLVDGTAAGGGLPGRPAPNQALEPPVVRLELIEADEVDSTAGHRRGGLGGDAVVGRAGPLGHAGRVLVVADQVPAVLGDRVVGTAGGEVLEAERTRLAVVLPGMGERLPGLALAATGDDHDLLAGGADLRPAQLARDLPAALPLGPVDEVAELGPRSPPRRRRGSPPSAGRPRGRAAAPPRSSRARAASRRSRRAPRRAPSRSCSRRRPRGRGRRPGGSRRRRSGSDAGPAPGSGRSRRAGRRGRSAGWSPSPRGSAPSRRAS